MRRRLRDAPPTAAELSEAKNELLAGALTTAAWVPQLVRTGRTGSADELSWPYLLVKAALPEFSRMYEREWELKAWAQLALACSELNRFRAERGRYPKDISELSPKTYSAGLLRDIFSGGKLPYTLSKDGKSFELCSTGAYGKKQDAFGRSFCIKQ